MSYRSLKGRKKTLRVWKMLVMNQLTIARDSRKVWLTLVADQLTIMRDSRKVWLTLVVNQLAIIGEKSSSKTPSSG